MKIIQETNFPGLRKISQGKVRDIYDLGELLLIVTTDRISAFDVVLPDPIPYKGYVLNQISAWWFGQMGDIMPHHMISIEVAEFPRACQPYAEELAGRSMLVRKAKPLPVECIVRGYLTGSGLRDYQRTGEVCGQRLPPGLTEASRLKEPIFTPSTKAERGHDVNISFEEMCCLLGRETAEEVRSRSLAIYRRAREIGEAKGIIIADTKFEMGELDGQLMLIDELLTPDSSRFWPRETYREGVSQPSFDKQYLRNYLLSLSWDREPPGPRLPPEVIENTSQRYLEALRILTGRTFFD